jgi:hypothetical protein
VVRSNVYNLEWQPKTGWWGSKLLKMTWWSWLLLLLKLTAFLLLLG